jgi:hypothetical protein
MLPVERLSMTWTALPRPQEFLGEMRADESGAAGDEVVFHMRAISEGWVDRERPDMPGGRG